MELILQDCKAMLLVVTKENWEDQLHHQLSPIIKIKDLKVLQGLQQQVTTALNPHPQIQQLLPSPKENFQITKI